VSGSQRHLSSTSLAYFSSLKEERNCGGRRAPAGDGQTMLLGGRVELAPRAIREIPPTGFEPVISCVKGRRPNR
jgi:hypothetical protein